MPSLTDDPRFTLLRQRKVRLRKELLLGALIAIVLAMGTIWVWNHSRPPGATAAPRGTAPSSTPAPNNPADVMLLLDASRSMLAEDYYELDGTSVSRFELLRRKTVEFISNHPNERIGAVAFAGAAYVLSAPTSDHANLLAALDKLTPDKLEPEGTAIGSAIVAGYVQLATPPGRRKRMLILATDGDNNFGFIAPVTAAEIAGQQNISMLVIGLGHSGGARFPRLDSSGNKTYVPMRTTLDEAGLRRVSDVTAGLYRAAPNARALVDAFHEFEAVKEECVPGDTFTASIPERFAASFGTASLEADKLVFRRLPGPAGPVIPKVGAGHAPSATPPGSPPSLHGAVPAADAATAGTAAESSLSAHLSKSAAFLGETVDLTIIARDVPGFTPPQAFSIDGLRVSPTGSNQSINIFGGSFSKAVEYHYSVKPERTGAFLIPSQAASTHGKTLQTSPLLLLVDAGAAGGKAPLPPAVSSANGWPVPVPPKTAANPSLTARLSLPVTPVGETVDLVIKARGLPDFAPPKEIPIEGLEVKLVSTRQYPDYDGTWSTINEYRYAVKPTRVGTFTIPPQTASAGEKTLQTKPEKLFVEAPLPRETDSGTRAFAEIVPAGPEVKMGEPIGVEIRLGVDGSLRWQPTEQPLFLPENCVREEMPPPKIATISRNGVEYNVVTFQTTLTPLKSGPFKLGPETLHYKVQIPVTRRTNGPFDTFGEIFSERVQTRTIQAAAVTIDVKP